MSTQFRIGDHVINVDPRTVKGENYGQKGVVLDIRGGTVYVQYANGNTGNSNKPEKYYKLIEEYHTVSSGVTKMTNSIKTFVKNLGLSADDKLLRKHGLQTECGDFTDLAQSLVLAKLTADNKAYLVEQAKAFEAELKAEKED